MTWTVSPSIVKAPHRAESLLLALGKSLYLASTFEKKCQYVLRLFDLSDMLANLSGLIAGGSFQTNSDSHGGTLITY
jgi:hypothetical protein